MGRRCNARTAEPATFRSLAEVTRFFHGLEPVEPGVVRVPERAAALGGSSRFREACALSDSDWTIVSGRAPEIPA